jgi:hypothetical protein
MKSDQEALLMTRFPIKSDLPGLAKIAVNIFDPNSLAGNGTIKDIRGRTWSLVYRLDNTNLCLEITEDNSMCTFSPWCTFPDFWSVTGIIVNTQRVGLASAFYKCAQQLIRLSGGRFISPSDNVTPAGCELWKKLDPSIRWESVDTTGGFRLDLSDRIAP